jgi:hypothetical protein
MPGNVQPSTPMLVSRHPEVVRPKVPLWEIEVLSGSPICQLGSRPRPGRDGEPN